jgi:hypothetical protein
VEKIMKQLGLSTIVAIALSLPAFADPPQLKGDYAFTYNDFCLQSTSGFNPNGTPLAGPVEGTSTAGTGFEHFNGDGTGTVKIISNVEVTLASIPLGSSITTPVGGSFQFTYAFNPDGSFTMTTVPGTFIAPGSYSINPGFVWLGFISNDGKTHTLTSIPPVNPDYYGKHTATVAAYHSFSSLPFQRDWDRIEPG